MQYQITAARAGLRTVKLYIDRDIRHHERGGEGCQTKQDKKLVFQTHLCRDGTQFRILFIHTKQHERYSLITDTALAIT